MTEPQQDEVTRKLVQRTADGDQAAFDELYKRYEPLVRWVVRSRLKGAERRRLNESDLLQTAFLKVYRSISDQQYEEEGRFRAWLVRTVQNKVQDSLRREFADQRDVRKEVKLDTTPQPGRDTTRVPTPSMNLSRIDEVDRLWGAMDRLPTELREVILQRDFELQPWALVADRLGCAESTARERHRKAYMLLGDFLAEPESGPLAADSAQETSPNAD